jgi:hypothetical protein
VALCILSEQPRRSIGFVAIEGTRAGAIFARAELDLILDALCLLDVAQGRRRQRRGSESKGSRWSTG